MNNAPDMSMNDAWENVYEGVVSRTDNLANKVSGSK